jgi:hypothetical protein
MPGAAAGLRPETFRVSGLAPGRPKTGHGKTFGFEAEPGWLPASGCLVVAPGAFFSILLVDTLFRGLDPENLHQFESSFLGQDRPRVSAA